MSLVERESPLYELFASPLQVGTGGGGLSSTTSPTMGIS